MRIAFFEIEQWEADYVKEKLPGNGFFFTEKKIDKDNLDEVLQQVQDRNFDAISIFVGSEIKKEVIDAFPNLKLLTTRSTGFDHIDFEAIRQKNIKTGYVPGYGDNTVAEFTFALILNLSRKIFVAYDRIKEKGLFDFKGLRGFDLKGKTIGVVGTGRIGKYTVAIAKGFGMNVLAFDSYPDEKFAAEKGFKYVSLDELLENSDVISLHVPYFPSTSSGQGTHHLINSNNINKIKKGALLINTARGAIVETDALVKALNEGRLGGYGADVLEEEGIIKDERQFLIYGNLEGHNLKTVLENHVLIDMPNVIITPHNAFNTTEALQRILDTDTENIKNFIEKGETKFPIPIS